MLIFISFSTPFPDSVLVSFLSPSLYGSLFLFHFFPILLFSISFKRPCNKCFYAGYYQPSPPIEHVAWYQDTCLVVRIYSQYPKLCSCKPRTRGEEGRVHKRIDFSVVEGRVSSRVVPQTSYNIDCVLGSLCYIRPCSIWIAWQRSSPMKGELRWRGARSISKFHHHNINGGAVDDTWRHR
jgi:hypothetical protein